MAETLEFIERLGLSKRDTALVCAMAADVAEYIVSSLAKAYMLRLINDPIKVHKAVIAALIKTTEVSDKAVAELKERMGL